MCHLRLGMTTSCSGRVMSLGVSCRQVSLSVAINSSLTQYTEQFLLFTAVIDDVVIELNVSVCYCDCQRDVRCSAVSTELPNQAVIVIYTDNRHPILIANRF